jgi:hypothetical protein
MGLSLAFLPSFLFSHTAQRKLLRKMHSWLKRKHKKGEGVPNSIPEVMGRRTRK